MEMETGRHIREVSLERQGNSVGRDAEQGEEVCKLINVFEWRLIITLEKQQEAFAGELRRSIHLERQERQKDMESICQEVKDVALLQNEVREIQCILLEDPYK